MPPPQILISTTDGRYQLTADMGPTPAKITDGYGGWQVITRPRKVGFTQYQGRNPFSMQIHIMFDGYAAGVDQEPALRMLTWMSIPADGQSDPPRVRLYGPALPYPSTGDWVINQVEYGDSVIWDKFGKKRFRQDVTLTLMKYVRPDSLDNKIATVGLTVSKSHVENVKPGDTLRRLAAYWYGDAKQYRVIADANGLIDPVAVIKLKKIRIP